MDIMNKKLNSFTKIITVLLALLLLGIAAGPASAAPVISGLNVSSSTDIVTVGGNITLKITANQTNLTADSIWINKMNVTSNFVTNSTGVVYSVVYTVHSGDADVSNGSIEANVTLKNGSTPSNAYSTVDANNLSVNAGGYHLDNISSSAVANSTDKFMMILTAERGSNFSLKSNRTNDTFDPSSVTTNDSGKAIFNITSNLTGSAMITANGTNIDFRNLTNGNVLFVAGPAGGSSLDSLSSIAVANNTDKFTMILTAPNGSTFNLKSNRSQDNFDPSSVTTNSSGKAIFNITSTLAGRATITANGTNLNLTNGTVLFVAGPAAKLAIFGPDGVTGVTTIYQTVALQDAYGNNVTKAGVVGTYQLLASKTSGSASITSTNPLNMTNDNASDVGSPAYSAIYNSTFTITANSVGAGAVTFEVTTNGVTGIGKTVNFYGPIDNLNVTTNKTSLYANNGNDSVLVTVQLKDASGNNIQASGVTVQLGSLTPTLFNSDDIARTNTTNANGITTFVVKSSNLSGSGIIKGTVTVNPSGGNGQTGSSQTITMNPAPSDLNSGVSGAGTIATGSNKTITATIKDYNNVAISGKSVTFNITTGDATFANNGAKTYTTTSASTGKAMADITSTNASALNSISVNVTIADENEVIKQVGSLQNFTVTPGSPTQYSITPGTSVGLTNVKGTPQLFNITVKDSIGNLNTTANGTINITTDNQALGNMSNGTTVLNNLIIQMTNGNASFNYTVNSTTVGTAVLTLNSTSLGIVNTTVTISTSGATGIAIAVNKSVQDTSSDVQVSAQLTGSSGNLAINDIDITFVVKNAAGVIQRISTNATNTSGIAVYNFNQSVAGVYTVTASNASLVLTNSTTVTFAGPAASIVVTANNTAPAANTTVTINVTVKDSSGVTSGSLGTGIITFLADGSEFASASLSNGVTSTTYSQATPGAVTITAFYNAILQNTTSMTFTAGPTPTPTPTPMGPQLVLTLTAGTKAANFTSAVLLDNTSAIVESASSISGDKLTATFNLSGITPGFYSIEVNGLTGDRVPTYIDNNTITQNESVTGSLTGIVIGDASNPTKYRIKARSGGRHPVVNFATGQNESKLPFIIVYNTSVQKIEIRVVNTSELLSSFTPTAASNSMHVALGGTSFQDWQFGSNNHGIVYNNTDSSCIGCHTTMNTKPANYADVGTGFSGAGSGWCFKCHYGGTNGGDSNGFVDPNVTPTGATLTLTLNTSSFSAPNVTSFTSAVLLNTAGVNVKTATIVNSITAQFDLTGLSIGDYFIEVNGLTNFHVPTRIDSTASNIFQSVNTGLRNSAIGNSTSNSVLGDVVNPTYRIKVYPPGSASSHPVVNFATGLNESKFAFVIVSDRTNKIEVRVLNTSEELSNFTGSSSNHDGYTDPFTSLPVSFQLWILGDTKNPSDPAGVAYIGNHGHLYNASTDATTSACSGCHPNLDTKPATFPPQTGIAKSGWCFRCHYGAAGPRNGFVDSSVVTPSNSSITGVTITPTTPSAGSEMNITVAINNPGASFTGRVEGNVWLPDGSGKYLGWETVTIPSGASTVTITGAAGGNEASYIPHIAGAYHYDVFLENVDKGQVYTNFTDARLGVAFTVGTAATAYISNVTLSSAPTNGSVMTLSVTISNPTASAFAGTMDANVWDSASGHVLTPQNISITASGSTTLTFSYTPVKTGLHSYDFFMLSPGQNTKAPWGFPCKDYVAGIGFNVV